MPKQFRLPGDRVLVHREGKRLIVEPIESVARDAKGHPIGLWDHIDAVMAGEAPPPIGERDLMIAAIAIANGCRVVTDHLREFRRVPGLLVENWAR